MKKRWFKSISGVIFLFVVEIFACNFPILKNLYWKGFISRSVLNESMIMGDYHGAREYGFVCMAVFTIYVSFLMKSERRQEIIRYEKRKKYMKRKLLQVFEGSIIFSVIHEGISVIFLIIMGDVDILMAHKWIFGVFFQLIVNVVFFMQIYIIYEIFNMFLSRGTAQIMTIASYTILDILFDEMKWNSSVWMPGRDLTMLQNLCGGTYTWLQCSLGILRMSTLTLIVFLIYQKNWREKEWYGMEKR